MKTVAMRKSTGVISLQIESLTAGEWDWVWVSVIGKRTFVIDDGSSFVDKKSSNWLSGAIIKSMSDHWSLGLGASNQQSTYYNLENGSRIAGAIEYNIFPYQLSSEKELKFGYFVGLTNMKYEQITILGELEKPERTTDCLRNSI